MSPEEAFAACAAVVRRSDPDRYFASLFAPAGRRPLLFALYAFNHEIVRATEIAREPMMAEIRLQWWREAVDEAREGRPRAQPAAIGLAELLQRAPLAAGALHALIDARGEEISSAPFAHLVAIEAHADATSGALMRVAATLLNADAGVDDLAREAGIAYGLAGILRSMPFHAARGKSFLPADLLAARGDKGAIVQVANMARDHFEKARRLPIPRGVVPAILPASLVPAYLSRLIKNRSDVSLFRRQLILLRAATFGM
ncbi:MAG TPA: squalene/phytoene synthase family protein [Rhizomicrobium sp.]|nr:squalene/phytoene synthase family protein [Rhizomicrobium sp.]